MFSCEYCKISSNICFEEQLHTVASENNNIKRFVKKTSSHNDHDMIYMVGQRSLIDPYLQHRSTWCRYLPSSAFSAIDDIEVSQLVVKLCFIYLPMKACYDIC